MLWSVYPDKYTVSVSSVEDTRDILCIYQVHTTEYEMRIFFNSATTFIHNINI